MRTITPPFIGAPAAASSQLIIPDPRWEMPELLVPGRKPTGPVVIDENHPTAKKRVFFFLCNQLRGDYIDGMYKFQDVNSDLITPQQQDGMTASGGTDYKVKAGNLRVNEGGSADTMFVSNAGVASLAPPSAAPVTYTYIWRGKAVFTSQGSSINVLLAYGHGAYTGINVVSGNTLEVYALQSKQTYSGVSLASTITIALQFKYNATSYVWVNGVRHATSFTAGTASNGSGNRLSIAGDYINAARHCDSTTEFAGVFVDLLDSEIISMSHNPYHFLLPA